MLLGSCGFLRGTSRRYPVQIPGDLLQIVEVLVPLSVASKFGAASYSGDQDGTQFWPPTT